MVEEESAEQSKSGSQKQFASAITTSIKHHLFLRQLFPQKSLATVFPPAWWLQDVPMSHSTAIHEQRLLASLL